MALMRIALHCSCVCALMSRSILRCTWIGTYVYIPVLCIVNKFSCFISCGSRSDFLIILITHGIHAFFSLQSSLKPSFRSMLLTRSTVQPKWFDSGVSWPQCRLLSFRGCTHRTGNSFLLSQPSSRWPFVHSARQDGSSFAVKIYFSLLLAPPRLPCSPFPTTHIAARIFFFSVGSSRHRWHATCFIAH